MKKAIKWIGIILLLLLILLFTLPYLFKDKIVAKIKEEANKSLNAKFDFSDFNLSLIRHFPNFSMEITGLSVINNEPFAGDTLVYSKTVSVTVDVMSVISGDQIKIKSVDLDSPVMNFLVTKDGKPNWDIMKPSALVAKTESKPSSFKASLQKYSVEHGRVVYDDKSLGFWMMLDDFSHQGKGDFTQDLFTLSTKTECKSLGLSYGGVKYINQAKTNIDADLDMDMKNFKFTFKDNKILLNELELGFSGWLAMQDTNMDMDLKFSAAKSDFKNFISLIPAVYSSGFNDVKASGKMSLEGWAKGRYNTKSLPGFGMTLNIDNGAFKYPSLPADVKNVFVDFKVSNPDGVTDHTVINLSRMHVEIAGNPFYARLVLKTPISDPDVDAAFKGKIDLNSMQKIVPLEKGTALTGVITSDLSAKGKYSSIKNQKYDEFSASGSLNIADMNYSSSGLKYPVAIKQMNMTFNPKTVALSAFNMKTGGTDLQANGSLENFIPYALKGETLKGVLKMSSSKIDLNEWMGGETAKSTTPAKVDTTSLSVIDVPQNIDFTLNASINSLVYQNLDMENVTGSIIIKDKAIRMSNLVMHLLDGSLTMNGGYSSVNLQKPTIDFGLDVSDFDIQKTAAAFNTVEKMAPIAKSASGKFSCKMDVKGDLDTKMGPIIPSLTGGGKLNTSTIKIQNFPPTTKISDALKMPSLKNLDVPNTNISFKFANGRVYVDPFDVTMNGFKSTIAGSNGFDQTIDYTMNVQIPRASFGGPANSVLNGLMSQAKGKGANVSVGDVIPVALKITGTNSDPKVSTDLNQQGAKAMSDLKAAAAAEFDKKKSEAEAKAKAEVDKLKSQAQDKVNAETDRLKKEADAKTKAVSDSIKKAAGNKAKDQLDKFNPFKKK